jgi:hypothetical protein
MDADWIFILLVAPASAASCALFHSTQSCLISVGSGRLKKRTVEALATSVAFGSILEGPANFWLPATFGQEQTVPE